MDEQTAFRFGFLSELARHALTPRAVSQRIKRAGILGDIVKVTPWLALSAPFLAVTLGHKVGDPIGTSVASSQYPTIEEQAKTLRKKELIMEYHRAAQRIIDEARRRRQKGQGSGRRTDQ